MVDIPVFMIAAFTVHDAAAYRLYEKGFFPILRKHGGSFVTLDDRAVTLEGSSPGGRIVMFSFPSETAARGWYDDPDYQRLSQHRRAGTEGNFLTIVHGLPPRA